MHCYGLYIYKLIKQMIKVICKVKTHLFSNVRTCSDIKWPPSRLPKIQPFGQSKLPQIGTICGGEIWMSGLVSMLSPTHRPNSKNPTRRHTLPFFPIGPSISYSIFRHTGTFLTWALTFRTRWCSPHLRRVLQHVWNFLYLKYNRADRANIYY